ncbi:ArsR family transcriptional regulator [Haladaptatus sp. GCM10025707]|uniref:ArsR family transcriptional regulator n=1 Tax=unclassified Haladaptatus TaxID=2622732 RepID=UPI0023E87CC1|nr:ArsR family transcriptional regulator [Haladaptatus sp. QDMS2]
MHPSNSGSDSPTTHDSSSSATETFNEWFALQKATDKVRANLIADLTGHPTMASVEELDYMNPDLSDHSIRRHLTTLMDAGVVEEFELDTRLRDFPYKFYTITPEARDLFDRDNLFPVEAWKRQYAKVKKTPRIREVESMPRPEN